MKPMARMTTKPSTDTRATGKSRAPHRHHTSTTRDTTVIIASDWAPIRAFDAPIREDPESIYGDLLSVLRSADLRIVNCECALTSVKKSVWKSGAVFKGEPAHVRGLTAVPFEVACLANNHVLDYGVSGLRQTLSVLHRNGIRTVGAGLTDRQAHAPLTITSRGVRIHIVNISEGEDLTASRGGPGVFGWDLARALTTIRTCKQSGGVVIAIAHCGLEYIPYPPPYVVAAFRAMVEAGSDCVIGHHPHVPQGLEFHKGRPIAYSLGNFAFYQHTDLYHRKVGYCVALQLRANSISSMALCPYRITDSGLRRLEAVEDAAFRKNLVKISRPFKTAAGPDKAWQAYLAYYGQKGFTSEVQGILGRMKAEPHKAAAMFRNRITTMQHVELWRDYLTRAMKTGAPGYSREAFDMAAEYFTSSRSPSSQ
jgi:poly-gamma-glutamate capsule biosynthesis protein CapA/YwtB (metallophosphatase superfamily)